MKSTQRGDANLNSDGMVNGSAQRAGVSKYSGNQHGGAAEGNFGRGPTTGNHGSLNDGRTKPPVSAVPALPAQGSVRDSINRGAQVRNPGGVKAMPKCGRESFDMGRGPTRGNKQ